LGAVSRNPANTGIFSMPREQLARESPVESSLMNGDAFPLTKGVQIDPPRKGRRHVLLYVDGRYSGKHAARFCPC
jgi:hypothetical protein